MRKAILRICLFLALTVFSQGDFLSAQTSSWNESEYYFFNYTIEKVFMHRLGYIVVYRMASNRLARVYVPHEWFNDIGGKGEIVYLGSGKEWPSMIVYHKKGEFSHIRLRLRQNRNHESWDVVPFNVDIDKFFEGIEEIKMEY